MSDILSFEDGVANASLEQLNSSVEWEMLGGKMPATRPVEHYEVFENVMESTSSIAGVKAEIENIWISERHTRDIRRKKDKEGPCPVDSMLIDRLVGKINLPMKSDKEMSMSVGIAFNDRGISLAFGSNVFACSNLTVFGNNLMHTYGSNKIEYSKMIDVFGKWMHEFEKGREWQFNRIETMKSTFIEEKETVDLLFGKLMHQAVLANMDAKNKSPLTQTQVANFIRSSYDEQYAVPVTEKMSVWDLQEMGTSILHPKNNSMVEVFNHSRDFSDFLWSEFCAN